jgi:hypothetical protein
MGPLWIEKAIRKHPPKKLSPKKNNVYSTDSVNMVSKFKNLANA